MELKQILIFQKVVHHKSFSRASKELFFTQPTVTTHILELEKELNTKLFHRGKTLRLTYSGEIFLKYVNQIMALQNDAIGVINKLNNGKIGTLKLALTGPDSYWLLPLLDKFKLYYSNSDLAIYNNISCDEIINMVLDREVDFGLIRKNQPVYVNPHLFSKKVHEDETVFTFSSTHKFAKLESIELADVVCEPIIAYGKGTELWDLIQRTFNDIGLNPKICMESLSFETVKLFLRSGGISFLPYICVKDEIAKGVLNTATINNMPPIKRHSILIYRKDMQFNDFTKSFMNLINRSDKIIDSENVS